MSIVAAIVVVSLEVVLGMQLLVLFRANATHGNPAPAISGPIGKQVKSAKSAL